MSKLNKRNFPFLNDDELSTKTEVEARELDTKRFEASRVEVQRAFVEQARELKVSSDRKSEEANKEYERYLKVTGDTGTALDMYLYNNPAVRMRLNALRPDAPIGYGDMAKAQSEAEFIRYMAEEEDFQRAYGMKRATSTSTDAPGQGNTLQTTVAQSITYRVDNFDQVVSRVKKVNQPYGNFDATIYNKYGLAGYMAEGSAIPDSVANLTDATNGISKVSYAGKQFGISFRRTWLAGKRISASVIADQMRFTEMEFGRGEAYQILTGPGTGLNDSGVTVIGTAATAGANALETFVNAKTAVSIANASNLVAFMNGAAWGVYEKIATTDLAFDNKIGLKAKTIYGVPVIVVSTAIMPTTTGAAKVVVGDFDHYIRYTNGGMEALSGTEISNSTSTNVFNTVNGWLMSRDGGALFNDSFAQYTLTV